MTEPYSASGSISEWPLVTLALFSYNHEKYICDAIKSALTQTYSPLEIILSDDCSTDATYEIMNREVRAYCGHHKVMVRQTKANRGLAMHINEVLSEANGDFIVMAAGDDISRQNRVQRLVDERVKYDGRAVCIYSDYAAIDSSGKILRSENCHSDFSKRSIEEFLRRPFALVSTYAFDIEVFTGFGPLNRGLRNEDFIFPFRALLLDGTIIYVKDVLVEYRLGVGHLSSDSGSSARNRLNNAYGRRLEVYKQFKSDVALSKYAHLYESFINRRVCALVNLKRFLSGESMLAGFLLFKALFYCPNELFLFLKVWFRHRLMEFCK